jgi:hypothetical protein
MKLTMQRADLQFTNKFGDEFKVIYKPCVTPPNGRPDKTYHISTVWRNNDKLASYISFEQPSRTSALRQIRDALKNPLA